MKLKTIFEIIIGKIQSKLGMTKSAKQIEKELFEQVRLSEGDIKNERTQSWDDFMRGIHGKVK